jgi:uncharacterized protein YndB with AHSA1/START domain
MPTNKDFKRVVRDRMKKTGESYTAARAQLLRHEKPAAAPNDRAAAARTRAELAAPAKADYAAIAGMSDASVKKATGCTWERWVRTLDKAEADRWTHKEIAAYVRKTYKTPDWWTQMVTVGYERIKGLRVRGQQRDGTFEVSKSKVVHVPVDVLFEAFVDTKQRNRWLPDANPEVRHSTRNKSLRLRWTDGSAVDIGFFSKSESKSQVAIGHTRLASQAEADRMKAFWTERLVALADLLAAR